MLRNSGSFSVRIQFVLRIHLSQQYLFVELPDNHITSLHERVTLSLD